MKPDKQTAPLEPKKRGGSARPVKKEAGIGTSLGNTSQVPPKNFESKYAPLGIQTGTKKTDPSPSAIAKAKRGESPMIKTNNLLASAAGGSHNSGLPKKKVPNSTKSNDKAVIPNSTKE